MDTTASIRHTPAPPPRELALDPRPAIVLGIATIALVFCGFGTWAAWAPISSAAIAPGFVTVDGNRKKVQHLDGGIVKELRVRDGAEVQPGDVLVRLDEVQPQATLAMLQGSYDAARALEARLLAENARLARIDYAADLLARAAEPKVAEILRVQDEQFQARRSSLEGASAILHKRIAQLSAHVGGLQAQHKAKAQQLALLDDELTSARQLFEQGYFTRPRLSELERQRAELEGDRSEHVSEIARAKTTIGETEIQILQLQKDFREKVVDEMQSVRNQVADLEQKVAAARHVLDNVEIRAPAQGVVVGMGVHTVGGVIRPGDTLLEIVPRGNRLIIEAQVQPVDIDSIRIGQQADIRLTAFKAWATPTLVGDVVYVSADRFVAPRTDPLQPEQAHFQARIAVTDEQLARLGQRKLYPGMPAEVMIRTGERTTLQYLAQPFLDRIERAWRED